MIWNKALDLVWEVKSLKVKRVNRNRNQKNKMKRTTMVGKQIHPEKKQNLRKTNKEQLNQCSNFVLKKHTI